MSRRILALPAALLLLTGCGGGSDSPVTADPAPAPSTASTSVQSSPSPPAPETAEEFIRRWLQAEVEMENTGKSTTYRALTDGCGTCAALANRIDGYYAAGGYVRFGGQKVTSIAQLAASGNELVLEVDVDPAPTAYRVATGQKTERLSGEPLTFKVTLKQREDGWALIDYTQLAS